MQNQPSNALADSSGPSWDKPPIDNPIELHPVDRERLELQGNLPDLALLINPVILEQLRKPPSSVHTIETSDRNPTLAVEQSNAGNVEFSPEVDEQRQDYTYRGYLLRPRMDAYLRALEIYADVDGGFGGKFSSRLQSCRRRAWFVKHKDTNHLRVMSSRCKLRWCPICRDCSRLIVTTAVEGWLQEQDYPKMLTLTLEHSDDPLRQQIKKLYDSFRKLRTRAYFKRNVTGGIWFFQLKLNHTTEQWHPHIHCLIAGKFLSHSDLKSLWLKITGTSYIVDIRPIKDVESAATEVARYATSPADLTTMSLEYALDVHYATKSRRICGTWGNARGLVLRPTPQEDRDDWIKVADFYYVNLKKEYDPDCKSFWHCFKKDQPYTGPLVQDERNVFTEEMALLRSDDPDPPTMFNNFMHVLETRSKFIITQEEPQND